VWRQLTLSSAVAAIAVFAILSGRRAPSVHPAQYRATAEPAVGRLLIARPQLPDPNFSDSVVLILQYDQDKGTVGLIINRPTKISLSRIFPQLKGAKADPVYEGGPVDKGSAQALLRSAEKPEGAVRVFGDVWATGSKDRIEKSVTAGDASTTFRLYAGYGGWGPGQLEHEIELGGWSVLRATAALVFDVDPDSLWQRLQHQTETRIATDAKSDRGFDSLGGGMILMRDGELQRYWHHYQSTTKGLSIPAALAIAKTFCTLASAATRPSSSTATD
jgi:putative transcriptional regulator